MNWKKPTTRVSPADSPGQPSATPPCVLSSCSQRLFFRQMISNEYKYFVVLKPCETRVLAPDKARSCTRPTSKL